MLLIRRLDTAGGYSIATVSPAFSRLDRALHPLAARERPGEGLIGTLSPACGDNGPRILSGAIAAQLQTLMLLVNPVAGRRYGLLCDEAALTSRWISVKTPFRFIARVCECRREHDERGCCYDKCLWHDGLLRGLTDTNKTRQQLNLFRA